MLRKDESDTIAKAVSTLQRMEVAMKRGSVSKEAFEKEKKKIYSYLRSKGVNI